MMSQKEIARWEKTRAKGKRRYVIGITIIHGLIQLAAVWLWPSLRFLWIRNRAFDSIDLVERLVLSGVFAMLGYVRSKSHWESQEVRYSASLEPVEISSGLSEHG
jgi:hypothetical protein